MKQRFAQVAVAALAALGCPARSHTPEVELSIGDVEVPPAPFALTAGDGSGLELVRVEARGVVEGPLAFTELHLHFHNPEPRIREGTFSIALPRGASVARFAMEGEAGWLEAEVVGTGLARRAYEDVLHHGRDPALLERAAANLFSARVFPIAPEADKHLVISFAHEVTWGPYVLPLRGLPPTPRIDIDVEALLPGGARTAHELHERDWRPDRDFIVGGAGPVAVSASALVAAVIRAGDAAGPADVPNALTLLVDTSGSRALDFARHARSVRELVAALPARYGDSFEVEVIAFDQEVRPIYRGPAAGYDDAHHAVLLERGAAGASNLGAALAWLADSRPHPRIAIVTDGVVTAGPELPRITDQIARLHAVHGLERLDVVLAGGVRDDGLAAALAHASGPRAGAVLDLDRGADDVAAGLGEAVLAEVPLSISGAAWVSPRVLPPVRPGQPVMVYARLAEPAEELVLHVGDERRGVALTAAARPLLEHAIARAEIEDDERALRETTHDARAAELRRTIEQRAIAARVVSSQTAMLVLESDADYERYGIDRDHLAEILVVGPDGIESARRDRAAPGPVRSAAGAIRHTLGDLASRLFPDDEGAPALALALRDEEPIALSRESAIEQARMAGVLSSVAVTGALSSLAATGVMASPGAAAPAPADPGPRAPWTGRFAEVMQALAEQRREHARALARQWLAAAPGDVLALVALGEALEALGRLDEAARAYGSIIDLYPARAELRRFAGERLERAAARGATGARALAIDTYRRAVADRPDHATGHRLLAYALLRAGDPGPAFHAILDGLDRGAAAGRRDGLEQLLREDAGMIAAAYLAAGGPAHPIGRELRRRGIPIATRPSTRFVLYWETDANDVDLHVRDALGGHAWYTHRELPSGGALYGDVTTGYGPECFAIDGAPAAGPYQLSAHYFAQGPMGFGMGLLQIQRFDGVGGIELEDRPYVLMSNDAQVSLGEAR